MKNALMESSSESFRDKESCRLVKAQTLKIVKLAPERIAEVSRFKAAYCRLIR